MKSFLLRAGSSSSGSAEQPAIINSLAGTSAEQPARETAQPLKALRSITDVQWWLKKNEVVLSSSAEAVRIREVVEALSTKPKPRQEIIGPFCKSWGVQQLSKKKNRPLSELIEELNTKVIVAVKELQQQLADSAERPLLLSHSAEQPVPMDTSADVDLDQSEELKRKVLEAAGKLHTQSAQSSSSASGSAEQPALVSPSADGRPDIPGAVRPDISMGVPRDFDINDFKLAYKRQGAWLREQTKLRGTADKPNQKCFVVAFALLQDCRKYHQSSWIVEDEEEHMKKLLRQLEILAQPHITSKACRKLYGLIDRNSTVGPFVIKDDHGHQVEQDHEHYRAAAFIVSMLPSLMSFFRRRDPLPAELYPYLASYIELLRNRRDIRGYYGHDVKVQWKKWPQDVREIWEGLPRTQDLWLLRDYAEHELDYLNMARDRDHVMGIPIESDDAIFYRCQELYPHPPVCSNTGWCRDHYVHQACACDKSCLFDLNCACAACVACENSEDPGPQRQDWTHIQAYKAANLAMGLGPCRPSPSI